MCDTGQKTCVDRWCGALARIIDAGCANAHSAPPPIILPTAVSGPDSIICHIATSLVARVAMFRARPPIVIAPPESGISSAAHCLVPTAMVGAEIVRHQAAAMALDVWMRSALCVVAAASNASSSASIEPTAPPEPLDPAAANMLVALAHKATLFAATESAARWASHLRTCHANPLGLCSVAEGDASSIVSGIPVCEQASNVPIKACHAAECSPLSAIWLGMAQSRIVHSAVDSLFGDLHVNDAVPRVRHRHTAAKDVWRHSDVQSPLRFDGAPAPTCCRKQANAGPHACEREYSTKWHGVDISGPNIVDGSAIATTTNDTAERAEDATTTAFGDARLPDIAISGAVEVPEFQIPSAASIVVDSSPKLVQTAPSCQTSRVESAIVGTIVGIMIEVSQSPRLNLAPAAVATVAVAVAGISAAIVGAHLSASTSVAVVVNAINDTAACRRVLPRECVFDIVTAAASGMLCCLSAISKR